MANLPKTKSDNYDVLGGIFDFLFQESRKPPQARRPIKPRRPVSGFGDGDQDLVDGVMTALAAPGVFVSDSVVDAFQDATDIELATIRGDDQTRQIKITTRSIVDLFKDPEAFMAKQSQIAKSRRKAGQALFLGRVATDLVVTAWAQKYADRDIQKATLAMSAAKKRDEKHKVGRAMGQYLGGGLSNETKRRDYNTQQLPEMDFMVQRSVDLIGQDTFRENWGSLNSNDRKYFTELLIKGDSKVQEELGVKQNSLEVVERGLAKRFGSKVARNFDKSIRPIAKKAGRLGIAKELEGEERFKNKPWELDKEVDKRIRMRPREKIVDDLRAEGMQGEELTKEVEKRLEQASIPRNYKQTIDITSPDTYLELEEHHLKKRIGESEGEEKRLNQRALFVLKGYKAEILNQVDLLKEKLRTETDPQIKSELKREIKEAKQAAHVLDVKGFSAVIGRGEGYINSLKQVWLAKDGGVFKSIFITQDFFNDRKNTILNPVKGESISAGKYNGILEKNKSVNVDFIVSKGGKGVKGAWNDMGEALYYANPKTWINTLYTGEGFAWLANKKEKVVKDLLGKLDDKEISNYVLSSFGSSDLKNLEGTIGNIMDKIKLANKDGKLSAGQLAQIEKLLNGSATFKKLAKIFSAPSRIKSEIENVIREKVFKAAREKIVKEILAREALKKLIIKYGGEKAIAALTKFAAQGGIKKLVQGLVSSIAGVLGLPAGGVGGIVTAVVTWVATEIIWQVGKVLIKVQVQVIKLQAEIMKLMLFGFIAAFILIIAIAGDAVGSFNQKHYPANQAPPNSVEICEAYDDIWDEDPDDDDDDDDDPPGPQPPLTDEECIIGTGYKYCTQGWEDVHCWSHQNMTSVYPVDLGSVTTITAPQFCGLSGADCKITTSTPLYCFSQGAGQDVYQGTIVDLYASYGGLEYNFHLIHVKPFAGVTVGKQLDGGEAVASVEEGLTIGNCWTGKHLHLSIKQNGGVVDPLKTLQSFNCDVDNEELCSDSPCCVNCACQYPCITNCSQCP